MRRSGAVTAERVPDLILFALPALRDEWPEVEEANADPDGFGGRLGYLDASWVVGHLADRMAADDTSEFAAAFALVEHLIKDGDAYVSELGVIGYLEGLQMETVTSRGVDPESFRPWFGPLTLQYWEAINAFWARTPAPPIAPNDDDALLDGGEFVTADRLTLVSRVGEVDLRKPTFIQAGESYRVDALARVVVVRGSDGGERILPPP